MSMSMAMAVWPIVTARFLDDAHVHHERQRRVAKRAAIDVAKRFFAAAPRANHRFRGGRRFRKLFFFLQRQAEIEVVKIERGNCCSVISNHRRFLHKCGLHLVQRVGFAVQLDVVKSRDLGANVRLRGFAGLRINCRLGMDFQGVVVRFLNDEPGRQQGFYDIVKINFGCGCNVF